MIIRRRHTANFATISNKLAQDERLAADEVGILYYLLTQPHDWEVRRPALMRRWRIGRDAIKRIVTNWMRTGWCRAEKIRLSDGTFHITYEICDEPGPALTEAEIREALSVVSTEAVEGHASNAETDQKLCVEPPTSQPALDEPHLADPYVVHIESLQKTDLENTDSTKGPPFWSEFRAAWPASEIISPFACEQLFAALSPDDRRRAFDCIGAYIANCKSRNRKLCDLSTYLKERRFAGELAVLVPSYAIAGGTPQAFRWLEYKRALGERTAFMEECFRSGKPWYAPTEWPPPLPKPNAEASPAPQTRRTG